uniref:Uncharacterized protein n=1 Tax=Magnetospirillum gryphiswaldense TaxID=55518 RepID=Q3BK76_9PROT|nr:hypothetical protein mgI555 [Magnetospirillum gryphiswaldense MSR-1]
MADGEARRSVARQRSCQGHGLHAETLARLHPLPRRRPRLHDQQFRRTRPSWHRARPEVLALRRVRPRWTACRLHVQPHRHSQDERHRSASLAGRCPCTDRGSPRQPHRRTPALELAERQPGLRRRRLTPPPPLRPSPDGYVSQALSAPTSAGHWWFQAIFPWFCPQAGARFLSSHMRRSML